MAQRLLIAIGAGLAAALLFIVPIKGTMAAMMIAFLASLPIMIAGLGFGQAMGLVAVAAGAAAISLYLHPIFGGVFAMSIGFPAWWLARLASLCRPAGENSPDLVWYPIDRLLGWIVALSSTTTIVLMGLVILRVGSYGEFVTIVTDRLAPAFEGLSIGLPGGYTNEQLARIIVTAMPPMMAGWGVVTLAVNLWLAGRIVLISQLMARPWADLPDHLALPTICRPVFAAALAGCLIDGPTRLLGLTIAAAIGVAYAFQGLAATHFITRGSAARTPILMGVYFAILVLLPWPLAIAAVVGLLDTFWPIRRPATPPKPKTPPTPTN